MAEENVQGQQEQQTQATVVEQPQGQQQQPVPQQQQQEQQQEEVAYAPTGDSKLDVVLGFLAQNGLDAEHPAVVAANGGDFSLLKIELEKGGKPGWQSYLQLAEDRYQHYQGLEKENEGKVADAVSGVLERHGMSNDDWGQVIEWVRANGDESEKKEINQLLSTPLGAKAITAHLIGLYREATNAEFKPAKGAIREDAGGHVAPQQQPKLTRAEFAAEADKLYRKYGNDAPSTTEYKQLASRLAR